jgi:hypothetical protein
MWRKFMNMVNLLVTILRHEERARNQKDERRPETRSQIRPMQE